VATEVISTIRSSGGDYTTLSAWEAGEQANLVTADEISTAECYDDWPSGLSDNVTVSGWTVDSTRYVKITVAAGHRHNGTPQTGFYLKKAAGFSSIILVSTDYTRLEWVDVENTDAGDAFGLNLNVASALAVNCIAKANSGGGTNGAIYAKNATVRNCLAWGGQYGILAADFQSPVLSNCTVANCGTGYVFGAGGAALVKNCVAYSNTTNYSGTGFSASSTNNATSTGSDDAPGGSSVHSVASGAFVNAASNDFHLASGSALIGAGTNLYSDFTTDIDGDTRPSSGAWDIGLDHRTGGAAAIVARGAQINQAVRRAGSY
jgi:hypothetical protein